MNLVWVIKSMKKRRNRWTIFFYKKSAAGVVGHTGGTPVFEQGAGRTQRSPRRREAIRIFGLQEKRSEQGEEGRKMAAFPPVKDKLVKKTIDLFFSFKRQSGTWVNVVPGTWILVAEKEIPRDRNNSTTSTASWKILGWFFLVNVERGWYPSSSQRSAMEFWTRVSVTKGDSVNLKIPWPQVR